MVRVTPFLTHGVEDPNFQRHNLYGVYTCVAALRTCIAYKYAIPVRACKHTGDMYAIHVRRFTPV